MGGGEEIRKIVWIKWETVCLPKEDGGLGVRRVGAFNLSLLGKWCWRLLLEKEALWYRLLKVRYGEEGGRLRDGGRQSPVWWRTMCNVRDGVGEGVGNWFEDNIRRVVGDGRDTFFWYDEWIEDTPLRIKFPRFFDLALEKESRVDYMGRRSWEPDGGAWVWRRRLFAWEEESLRECSFLLHNTVLQDNVHDTWRWHSDPVNGYSVHESYQFITNSGAMLDRTLLDDVWHKSILSKVSLLVWCLLRNRVPTKDNLVHRGVLSTTDMTCVAGCGQTETAVHLFLHCNFSCNLWYLVWKWIGIFSVHAGELRQHFIQFTTMAGMPRTTHYYFRIIWFTFVWVI